MRSAFEAWYKEDMDSSPDFFICDTGFYDDLNVQIAWRGYQAAIAAQTQPESNLAFYVDASTLRGIMLTYNTNRGLINWRTGDYCHESDVALYAAPPQLESKWISVDERLPEGCKSVLVVTNFGEIYTCRLPVIIIKNAIEDSDGLIREKFTHWMPLPPAPVGADK